MVLASLLALAFAQADEPIATSPRPASATSSAPAAGPPRDPEIPASAPTDDYGFVAWCHGALTGHMELHGKVKPELDRVSPGKDDEQLDAGREYLELYVRALKAAEGASPANIQARRADAVASGYRIWAAARAAEPRTQMWSYLMWELPARCEIVAKRLEERSSLFAEALRSAPPAPAASGQEKPVEPAPGPPVASVGTGGLRGAQ